MSIFSSTNPVDWGQLDGIYIDDTAPPPSVTGVATNIAILVGAFERGSAHIQSVGSVGQLYQLYGNNISFGGNISLQNKKFGLLKIVRVIASDAVAASKAFASSATTRITFSALWKGAYGNGITVAIAAGSTSGSKYTVHDGNANAVWPDEVYDNVVISAVGTTFSNSNLITATVNSSAAEPSTTAATALASGADGTVANTDYQSAIQNECQSNMVGNILFLDTYNTTLNGYLKTSMADTTDKMAIMAGSAGDSVSTAVTAVGTKRDADGRLIYSFPYVYTTIGGVSTRVNPASFYAAMLSQVSPSVDPAFAGNTQYLSGIDSLETTLQRSDYITLAAAGISAFDFDADIGFVVKSGVVTQVANSSKIMVFRRRMADFLISSLAKFLKNYQNAPNSLLNRTSVNAAIVAFNKLIETDGLVPKNAEVSTGKASLIDTKSLNTDDSIAAGYFKILYKRRIYSSMRFIVLQAEIGESVVVTDAG